MAVIYVASGAITISVEQQYNETSSEYFSGDI